MQENLETIGQRLKRIRLSRRISLEKAAETTRVRPHYLQALEEDNYSVMSSAAQGRGFLRLYAHYLGLDLEAATAELRESEAVDVTPPAASETAPETPTPAVAPPAVPASEPDEKADRRPFWARLLRRPVPAASSQVKVAAETESEPAVVVSVVEEVVGEVVLSPAIEVETISPAPTRVKKPAVKKAKSSSKTTKPVGKSKSSAKKASKPTAKIEDKKKAQKKSR